MKTTTLIFSSEHGGNQIPEKYSHLFKDYQDVLKTHRGHDIGVWSLADAFAKKFNAQLFKTHISRLLVDANRSLWRRTLFSEITKPLDKVEKKFILDTYYYPHRKAIADFIDQEINKGQKVLHIATHTFTPVLKDMERNADIGFLYNPERSNEKQISKKWKQQIKRIAPEMRVRFNYPYRGKPDGLTAHFRKGYPDSHYIGVELEVNQKFALTSGEIPEEICNTIVSSFSKTIESFSWL